MGNFRGAGDLVVSQTGSRTLVAIFDVLTAFQKFMNLKMLRMARSLRSCGTVPCIVVQCVDEYTASVVAWHLWRVLTIL
jgi:hypothetical protein